MRRLWSGRSYIRKRPSFPNVGREKVEARRRRKGRFRIKIPAMSKGCVIFDFDGVIADTELLHLRAYNAALAAHAGEIGGPLEIPGPVYFSRYIVFGDHEALEHMLGDHGRPCDAALVEKLAASKHEMFERTLHGFADPLPGVRELLAWLEERNVPRAICSGARREEVEVLLNAFQIRHHFDVVVTIEDVRRGKPEPDGYNLAFERLNLEYDAQLEKEWSLVIEDTPGGCAAARAAGLRVLGVATSVPLGELMRHATYVVGSLEKVSGAELGRWLGCS
jgi:beta-phosphoglucomutase